MKESILKRISVATLVFAAVVIVAVSCLKISNVSNVTADDMQKEIIETYSSIDFEAEYDRLFELGKITLRSDFPENLSAELIEEAKMFEHKEIIEYIKNQFIAYTTVALNYGSEYMRTQIILNDDKLNMDYIDKMIDLLERDVDSQFMDHDMAYGTFEYIYFRQNLIEGTNKMDRFNAVFEFYKAKYGSQD